MNIRTCSLMSILVLLFAGAGCGLDTSDSLIEDASFSAALSEGDGESLDGAPDDDLEGAAEEDADESLVDEVSLHGDCSLAGFRQRVLEKYDIDGDGQLSRAEKAALVEDMGPLPRLRLRWARHHRHLRLRWIYDADESRRLSEEERQQLREDLQVRCENRKAQLLTKFDSDEDGILSEAELQAARAALIERRQARRQEILAQYDADGDGQLGPEERQQLVADTKARRELRRQELREEFDTDGSGNLDEAERTALRQALRSRVRGEHFADEDRF